jgi:hypothetical protein
MIASLRSYTRQRRGCVLRAFLATFPRPLAVIDLGGAVKFWKTVGITDAAGLVITLANNHAMDTTNANQVNEFACVREWGIDVRQIGSQQLAEFDVIVSNSFIEHLTCWEDQRLVACRIIESGRPYFIQTPNKNSPIDPHFPRPYVPFFALYPKQIQARLLTLGELGGGWRAPTMDAALSALNFYNPLGVAEMRMLFPDAELHVERPLGIPMSILAIDRRARRGAS